MDWVKLFKACLMASFEHYINNIIIINNNNNHNNRLPMAGKWPDSPTLLQWREDKPLALDVPIGSIIGFEVHDFRHSKRNWEASQYANLQFGFNF